MLDYRVLGPDTYLTATFGRFAVRPWGLHGGAEGSPNSIQVIRADGTREARAGKVARVRLDRGDVIRLTTGTGGGWGPPSRRPRALVEADVRDGYITPEQAARDYGVM